MLEKYILFFQTSNIFLCLKNIYIFFKHQTRNKTNRGRRIRGRTKGRSNPRRHLMGGREDGGDGGEGGVDGGELATRLQCAYMCYSLLYIYTLLQYIYTLQYIYVTLQYTYTCYSSEYIYIYTLLLQYIAIYSFNIYMSLCNIHIYVTLL